jgi:tellurite resistance protein TehA-like permease
MLTYDPALWSIVFPLGMYAVAGIYLGRADHLPVVEAIGRTELWVAFAAWLLVLVSMFGHVVRTVLCPAPGPDRTLTWSSG